MAAYITTGIIIIIKVTPKSMPPTGDEHARLKT